MEEAYLYDVVRTPRGKGKKTGALYEVKPIDLLTAILLSLESRNQLDHRMIDDLIIGCVTPVDDQGYNIARAALLKLGWYEAVGGMQVNRYCASGLEAVNLAAMKIRSGWDQLIVAGGVESMSRIPMGSDGGALLYDPEVIIATNYIPQGISADLLATLNGFDRQAVDTYALQSHHRAAVAVEKGYFNEAIVPIHDQNGLLILDRDESIRPDTSLEMLERLHPAFAALGQQGFDDMAIQKYPVLQKIDHVHTAGNSSAIVDGAALVLLGNKAIGEQQGWKPRARIRAAATVSVEPTLMLNGPAPAARKALQLAGMEVADVDLWECNEAFAAVVLNFQRDLDLDGERLNVNGGAIALGHPLGATGAILLGGLLCELERRNLNTGLVCLCAGGGLGVATIIERI
ncbi:MAG TPA: acetyl-CoA C-acetyltransferase [Saprospiraceae bacterium]|nr:acetyl-CoA C-acetyltransferase [Saprospiraceae bacterium]HMQ82374.1 acetyl-CoA C-acetyltransferase [Saprospiraceae bacterium]